MNKLDLNDDWLVVSQRLCESEIDEICRKLDEIQNSQTKALLYIKDEYQIVRCFAQMKLGII